MPKRKLCWGNDDFDGWAVLCSAHGFRNGASCFKWRPDKPEQHAECGVKQNTRRCIGGRWVRVKFVEALPKKRKVVKSAKCLDYFKCRGCNGVGRTYRKASRESSTPTVHRCMKCDGTGKRKVVRRGKK